jgi:hypothetical protein
MKTGIKEFCIKLNEKIETDKDIKENKLDFFKDYRNRINFYVNLKIINPHTLGLFDLGTNLFMLDSEDLEYLHNKYSKKIKEEMNFNIEEVKKSYEGILKKTDNHG